MARGRKPYDWRSNWPSTPDTARGSTCEAEAGDQAAELARCPCQPARPGSIFDRWAHASTSEAFHVTATPEPVPDGPVLEDHDDREARHGTTS